MRKRLVYLRLNAIGEFNTIQIIANSFSRIKEHIYSKLCEKRLKNDVKKYINKKRELFVNYLRTICERFTDTFCFFT
ncbi:hypothetical protein COI98_32325 [Bacillus cereus]|uniref:Uncharacterized protein n=1 Tax=Bacillus cereus TaxID=1396 RepID=A0A9X6WTM8_BACCE|nr:hypothetical protein COI98_32325 [Bacillus cereus]